MQRQDDKRMRWGVAAGLVLVAIGIGAVVAGPSRQLARLSPDGALDATTARFVDVVPWCIVAGALLLSAVFASARLRRVLAGAWAEPPSPPPARSSLAVPLVALACLVLRIAIASVSDIGLGDDGARAAWLMRWLQDPQPVWSGFWAPGHLYAQAIVWLVLRDPVRAGVALSALAAAGTVWILGRRAEAVWGTRAGVLAALLVTLSPIGVAYGAVPDVNPFFALCVVAAVTSAQRSAATSRPMWLVVAWIAFAFASWSRFEAFLLAPAVAATLWPRRRAALAFGLALLVPAAAWSLADWLATGAAGRVVSAVRADPLLRGARASTLFSFGGAAWQGLTPPVIVLGVLGMLRALRARTGREWILPFVLHLGALAAAMWTSGAGTQSRYFIAPAAFAAPYAGAAVDGVWRRGRIAGVAVAAAALALLMTTPSLFPGDDFVWVCRDARLRAVVDAAARHDDGGHVVWISDEAAFFYPCRTRIPMQRYHGLGRADDSPAAVATALTAAPSVLACVQEKSIPRAQWDALRGAWRGAVAELEAPAGYRMFRMTAPAP